MEFYKKSKRKKELSYIEKINLVNKLNQNWDKISDNELPTGVFKDNPVGLDAFLIKTLETVANQTNKNNQIKQLQTNKD